MALVDKNNNGFGISSPDVPAISLDRPGLWKYSTNFIPEKPNVFFNLYNNQWSTNFTEWIEGTWNVKFYVWAFSNYQNESSLITPSEEFRVPLIANFSWNGNGKIPNSGNGVSLSMKGVMLTAFGKNPDGEGTLIRLWEQAGNNGKCVVSFPEKFKGQTATPVDLRGEVIGTPIQIKDKKLELEIKAYKPYSFIIK